jgi:hypothetical protein
MKALRCFNNSPHENASNAGKAKERAFGALSCSAGFGERSSGQQQGAYRVCR